MVFLFFIFVETSETLEMVFMNKYAFNKLHTIMVVFYRNNIEWGEII